MNAADKNERHVARCLRVQRHDRKKTINHICTELDLDPADLHDLETCSIPFTLQLLLKLVRAMTPAERNVFVQALASPPVTLHPKPASPAPAGAASTKPKPNIEDPAVGSKLRTPRKRAQKKR